MPEIWFYHLETRRLEDVLPALLERSLARGWRAVVQTVDELRRDALDDWLWSYRDTAFMPHASARDAGGQTGAVWLTCADDFPEDAAVRFLVHGADLSACLKAERVGRHQRLIVIFDGTDTEALIAARQQWAALRGTGHVLSYWKQNASGAWEKMA